MRVTYSQSHKTVAALTLPIIVGTAVVAGLSTLLRRSLPADAGAVVDALDLALWAGGLLTSLIAAVRLSLSWPVAEVAIDERGLRLHIEKRVGLYGPMTLEVPWGDVDDVGDLDDKQGGAVGLTIRLKKPSLAFNLGLAEDPMALDQLRRAIDEQVERHNVKHLGEPDAWITRQGLYGSRWARAFTYLIGAMTLVLLAGTLFGDTSDVPMLGLRLFALLLGAVVWFGSYLSAKARAAKDRARLEQMATLQQKGVSPEWLRARVEREGRQADHEPNESTIARAAVRRLEAGELLSLLVDAWVVSATQPAPPPDDDDDEQAEASAPAAEASFALLIQKNERDATVCTRGEGITVVLLAHERSEPRGSDVTRRVTEALSRERDEVLEGLRDKPIVVALIGGAPLDGVRIEQLPPRFDPLGAPLLYVDVGHDHVGPLAAAPDPPAVLVAAAILSTLPALSHTRHASAAQLSDAERIGEAEVANEGRFDRRMKHTPAVSALATLLIGLVAVAWAFGGGGETLYRMGMLQGTAVTHGDWARLLSSSLLHDGLLHAGLNSIGLLLFGVYLEAALGMGRVLMLFAVGALGGALMPLFFKPEQWVLGASGAVFGFMGAALVLTITKPRLFGFHARGLLSGMAAGYLVINGLFSLLPGISLLGHLGGALAGALFAQSGLLSMGLPSLGDHRPEPAWSKALFGALGALSLAALVASVVHVSAREHPWRVRSMGDATPLQLPGSPITLRAPPDLAARLVPEALGPTRRFVLGRGEADPVVVSVLVTEASDATDAEWAEAERQRIERAGPVLAETWQQPPTITATPRGPRVEVSGKKGAVRTRRCSQRIAGHAVDLFASTHGEAHAPWRRYFEAICDMVDGPAP